MTSLKETLPILDEAVPALPGKVEAVARTAAEFERGALEALSVFGQRRAEADALAEQVRQALEALRDHTAQEERHFDQLRGTLERAAQEQARGLEAGGDELQAAGAEAVDAFDQLQAHLAEAGVRTEAAHEEARGALEALAEEAKVSEQALAAATDGMAAGVGAVQQAIDEGRGLVSQAITSLKDAMLGILGGAQSRLGETYRHLEEVRATQQSAVEEATASLDAHRRDLEQEVEKRMESEVGQRLDPELRAVETAFSEMDGQAGELRSETATEREDLAGQISEIADRVPPLQGGAQQVRQAADQVGLAWPA
jgi:hypothetical protein